MKKLVIVRHAKSDWGVGAGRDFDRPLNGRGLHDVPRMSNFLRGQGITPDLILSSPAVRALTTARFFAEPPGFAATPLVVVDSLYLTDVPHVLDVLAGVDAESGTVMLVGHNPTQTLLLNYLTDEMIEDMPTCGVAVVDFPHAASWQELSRSAGVLAALYFPKQDL